MRLMVIVILMGLVACTVKPSASVDIKVERINERQEGMTNATVELINRKQWISGAANCALDKNPAIDEFEFDQDSYILRQNKCIDYEAPFIYVLFGKEKVLVVDTGATKQASEFPLYKKITQLIAAHPQMSTVASPQIIVLHSHSHSDHRSGDNQFRGQPNVTVVAPNEAGVLDYFGFKDWPNESKSIDLGSRLLTILAIPGHQDESIAIYDSKTQWLLTGDTVYPGHLYIFDWETFAASIKRLSQFCRNNTVSALLGAHIEMSNVAGVDYPVGTIYQPHESGLAISVAQLLQLNAVFEKMGSEVQEYKMDKFIISPQGKFKKALGKILGWFY